MAYGTGQITGSADPMASLVTQIEVQLTAHAAWTFIEEVVHGTFTVRVWKCAAATNLIGSDFYVGVGRAGSFAYMFPFEVWDATAKRAIRPLPVGNNTHTPEATFNSFGGTTGYAFDNTALDRGITLSGNTIDFTYWVLVTNNALIVATSEGTAGYAVYAGAFDRYFADVTNHFGLVGLRFGASTSLPSGAVSRRPGTTTSTAKAFGVFSDIAASENIAKLGYRLTYAGKVPETAAISGGRALSSRHLVAMYTADNGLHIVGVLPPEVKLFNTATGVGQGDTITVDGDIHVGILIPATYNGVFIDTTAA